jgi:hypothetical protein
MKSVTQLWKESQPGVSFKQWIDGEKALYEKKKEDGKIQGRMPFDHWINKRYEGKLNADGSSLKNIILQTAEKLTAQVPTDVVPTTNVKPINKTILGMKPVIFYSLTAGIVIIGWALIYKRIKKGK